MALTLNLYNFSKRRNSTKQPTGNGTVVNVVLKQDTSFNNPIFYLNGDDISGFNYAKFQDAYYWIKDVRSRRNDLWEIECEIDALATCRSAILATSAYVEYARQGNSNVVDSRLGIEYSPSFNRQVSAFSKLSFSGTYYLGVIGENSTEIFAVSKNTINNIMNNATTWSASMLDDTSIETAIVSAFTQTLAQGSAADCVKAAYWLPFDSSEIESSGSDIYLGSFRTNYTGKKLNGTRISETKGIIIPHGFTDWRRKSPYSIYYLYLPLYGTINIPDSIAARNDSLNVTLKANILSGDFTYIIRGALDQPSGDVETGEIVVGGNAYSPVLIGASNVAMGRVVGSLATTAIGAMVNPIAGFAGAVNTLSNLQPLPFATGAVGGSSNLDDAMQCFTIYYPTTEEPSGSALTHGIPLFKTATISTLSGYVKTNGFSLQGAFRSDIIDMVNDFMDSGVFIE